MSQKEETKPWVVTAVLKDDTTEFDPTKFKQNVAELFDKWQTQGKFLWSGPLDDNKTALTVFEGTDEEAFQFLNDYKKAASEIVDIELKQWDALPILSLL
ncbi:MAG: hypothetical protein GWN01_04595 [Nitrosopumilaceae archaeon]|nr:hypothetical protein [Nitrosopumilaceae archaeon]NIU86636.1 hypothetical protein [Nitrosopumilaceae archaeon]NIV66390.1 hypothetical protein [Nitrosopumilaceae archaeon]NIX60826.1 hypothetical protein [Nitrosopumilaceae archaeon]